MKQILFIALCAAGLAGHANASATAASAAQDGMMVNRDVGEARALFGPGSGCPNLVSADPVVLRAILPETARAPFKARLNDETWLVSRDARDELQMAAPKLSASGAAELRFQNGSAAGKCTYFYNALEKIAGHDLPQTKILVLTKEK